MNNKIIKNKYIEESDTESMLSRMTVAEFFAGIGLMRMGLEKGGWRVIFANDIDKQKQVMYEKQFSNSSSDFYLGDVHTLSVDMVPSVTLATASFPCNDLSLAGARGGLNGKESSAFWGFIRIVKEMEERKPPIVLLENVPGLLSSDGGKDLSIAISALNNLGYVVDIFILDAIHFVPQSRQRLFIVGVKCDLVSNLGKLKLEDIAVNDNRPKKLVDFIKSHHQLHWHIDVLPDNPIRYLSIFDVVEELPQKSPFWWSPERVEYLLLQMSPAHSEKIQSMISLERWSYGTVFRRMRKGKSMAELRTDGIAGCLRTPRGGSGRQILVKAGFGQIFVRLLTPRECARLMGADNYKIEVPINQALFGFGDAVCVPVIEWIAVKYLNPLLDKIQRSKFYNNEIYGGDYSE